MHGMPPKFYAYGVNHVLCIVDNDSFKRISSLKLSSVS